LNDSSCSTLEKCWENTSDSCEWNLNDTLRFRPTPLSEQIDHLLVISGILCSVIVLFFCTYCYAIRKKETNSSNSKRSISTTFQMRQSPLLEKDHSPLDLIKDLNSQQKHQVVILFPSDQIFFDTYPEKLNREPTSLAPFKITPETDFEEETAGASSPIKNASKTNHKTSEIVEMSSPNPIDHEKTRDGCVKKGTGTGSWIFETVGGRFFWANVSAGQKCQNKALVMNEKLSRFRRWHTTVNFGKISKCNRQFEKTRWREKLLSSGKVCPRCYKSIPCQTD